MARNPYEVLGLKAGCSQDAIRTSYRKLVLVHHPDHSKAPDAAAKFRVIVDAYELLSDPQRRKEFDAAEDVRRKVRAGRTIPTAPKPAPKPKPQKSVADDLVKLRSYANRGQYAEAERLAKVVLTNDPKQALPYAVLADIARSRGKFREAAKMYAFAAQMDPTNPEFETRHIQMLDAASRGITQVMPSSKKSAYGAVGLGGSVVVLGGCYLVLTREQPLLPSVGLVSSFTMGLLTMTLVTGVALGASLGLTGTVDRFSESAFDSQGRLSPPLALGMVALINFWLAAVLYLLIGSSQQSFQYSTSRVLSGVAVVTLFFGLCSFASPSLNAPQVLMWSGNFTYLGSLVGWLVTDVFRRD